MKKDRVSQCGVCGRTTNRCGISAAHAKNPVAWWATWAAHMKRDLRARWTIWAALDGNINELAYRLRKGLASPDEMAFVADLIERKVNPRQRRLGQPTRLTNDEIVQAVFQLQVMYSGFPAWPEERIKREVADMFGVKYRHVYDVLKALDPERRKFHERKARAVVKYIASAPKPWKVLSDGVRTIYLEKIARK
jgi:transposase